jgi:hypothetical protein
MVNGFNRITVDGAAAGAAWVSTGDINGDGKTDLVVSTFGTFSTAGGVISLSPGAVTAYLQGDSTNCWQKVPIVTEAEKLYFPNQTTLADLDGDGDLDVVVAAGFFVCVFDSKVGNCGAVAWYENDHGNWIRHDVVPFGDDHFYHQAVIVDFDGDGVKDLVTVGETSTGATTKWFKGNTSAARFDTTALVIGDGGGSLPVVRDIDGDGKLDVASAEYFVKNESFVWFRQTTPGTFERHVLDDTSGASIMFDLVPNLYGDGKLRGVGTNHVNTNKTPPDPVESAVFAFEIPADATMKWQKTQISTGIVSRPNMGMGVQAAPGVFGYGDVDGDGDLDIVVSGDGDVHTYWLEQTAPGVFATHVLEDSLGQAGGAKVIDLDGDGKNEVVFTGYEDGKVYVYTIAK